MAVCGTVLSVVVGCGCEWFSVGLSVVGRCGLAVFVADI